MPSPDAPPKLPYRDEVKRKMLHLLALAVPLGMALLGRTAALAVLIPSALLALAADVLRARSVAFAAFIQRVFGPLMRDSESPLPRSETTPPGGASVVFNGATWVLTTAALLVLLFPLRLAVPAFAAFMIADAAAALVGRRFGRHRWGRSERTVEGSMAFLLAGLAVMACFPAVPLGVGAAGVAVGCLAEIAGPLDDNVRVPLATAFTMWLVERLMQTPIL